MSITLTTDKYFVPQKGQVDCPSIRTVPQREKISLSLKKGSLSVPQYWHLNRPLKGPSILSLKKDRLFVPQKELVDCSRGESSLFLKKVMLFIPQQCHVNPHP